jgi:hypothetical protein
MLPSSNKECLSALNLELHCMSFLRKAKISSLSSGHISIHYLWFMCPLWPTFRSSGMWCCVVGLAIQTFPRNAVEHPRTPELSTKLQSKPQILHCKGKGSPYKRPWGPKRGSRGIALPVCEPRHEEGRGWLPHAPAALSPGKRPYCTVLTI